MIVSKENKQFQLLRFFPRVFETVVARTSFKTLWILRTPLIRNRNLDHQAIKRRRT